MVPVGSCLLGRIKRSVVARAGPRYTVIYRVRDGHVCWCSLSRRQQKVRRLQASARAGAGPWGGLARTSASALPPPPAGMSYKPNLTAHMPAAALDAGSVHSLSTSMATSSQYRQLLSDYGPPSLGYTQGAGNSQVPQRKYAELLAISEELGKEIRPTYAMSKSAMERHHSFPKLGSGSA